MKQHRKHIWKRGLVSFLAAMLVLNLCAPAVMTRAEELSGQDPAIQTPAAAGQGTIPMTWEDLGKLLEQGIAAAKTTPDDTANTGSSEETPGEGATGEGTTGEGTTGEGTTGEGTTGEGTSGEGTTGEGATGEGTSGEGTTGEGTSGEGATGEGTTGEGATGEGTSGEGTTGEGTTGEGTSGEGTEPAEGTQELLNYLLSARTYEELDAMMENMSEEDYVVLNQFNEEQNAALSAHVDKLSNYEPIQLDAVTLKQGDSATYAQSVDSNEYDFKIVKDGNEVSSSACGITVTNAGNYTIKVETSENTPVGDYTIRFGFSYYGLYFDEAGTISLTVTEKITADAPVVDSKNMTFDKTVTSNENGNYDLKLTLSGAVGSKTDPAKVDIVLVIDKSGSMEGSRLRNAKTAANTLINALNTNENIDVRYNVISFNGTNSKANGYTMENSTDTSGWLTSATAATNSVNSITASKATNYEAALLRTQEQLGNARTGATTIVVFLTDGNPTLRCSNYVYGDGTYGYGEGNDSYASSVKRCLDAAVSAVGKIAMNRFYVVGTGNVDEDNLEALKNGATLANYKTVKMATDNDLGTVFSDIAADVTTFLCKDVTITDTLNHVGGKTALDRMVEVTDVNTVNVTVYQGDTIIAGPAKEVTLEATKTNERATLTASYDQTTGVLKLDFPDAYQLEADYTYVLSAEIAPTEKAYEEFRNGGYTESGASNTGTHSGQFGFYSNDEAIVTYTYNDKQSTAAYAHPVIQLHPGKLVINKTIEGLTEEQIPEISFHVALTYPGATSATEVDIPLSEFTLKNGTYTREFAGLSPGTTYTVTENNYQVDGYNVKTTVNGQESVTATGSVAKDTTVTLNFTNAYSLANTTITLDKNVAGNMASHTDEFIFNVTIDGKDYTGNPIKLTHLSDPVQITVPIGANVTITEQASGSYVATATVDNKKADLSGEIDKTLTIESVAAEGHSVVFTNTNEKVVETGIHTDTYATYVMMSAMIVLAGFLMLGKARYTGKF